MSVWLYTLASIFVISLISLVGAFTFSIKAEKLKRFLIYFVAFSAGALFGGAFLHLLPEMIEEGVFGLTSSILILVGIVLFFSLEKLIHWQHCHMPITKDHVHSFAYMNLIGDGFHNFLDGIIIAGSFMINYQVGIATTIAVALHEIPQEIGDFGVLVHGGFSKAKALMLNFGSALLAFVGAITTLILSEFIEQISLFIIPLTIGGFIYIAGSDLIPELHKEQKTIKSILQIIAFVMGIAVMGLLLLLEVH